MTGDEAALWPVVHLRRLLHDEAHRLYADGPSPDRLTRLDDAATRLANAERALAAAQRWSSRHVEVRTD